MKKKLHIAVQKSGRLHDDSLKLLKDCGISIDNGKDQLKAAAKNFPMEVFYLRNGDIPQYLRDGVVDIAIIGENLLVEKGGKSKSKRTLPRSKMTQRLSVFMFQSDPALKGPMKGQIIRKVQVTAGW